MNAAADPPCAVIETENVWIPMPDGARLAARMWIPEGAETAPVPALLEYLPYRKRDGTAERDALTHPYLAGRGYACVRADMRGSGESDGLLHDEYLPQEQDDALALIDWITAQPWCSGRVGVHGISWGGFNALQIAARGHPAVKAAVPLCFTDDRYEDDIHYRGGCLLTENQGWCGQMMSYMTRPPDPLLRGDWREAWLERLAAQPFLLSPWMAHQHRDGYFKHGSVCGDFSKIKAAVLCAGGWGDGYKNAVPRLIDGLSPHAPVKGINGPWMHKYPHFARPGPQIDFLGEMLRWYDCFLKDADNGAGDGPAYRAYLLESARPAVTADRRAGRWIAAPAGPDGGGRDAVWRLGPGVLSPDPQPPARRTLCSPETAGAYGGAFCELSGFDNHPGDQSLDDGGCLVFETAPLAEDTALVGRPRLSLRLSSDRPAANLCARLSDVFPDCAATRITLGLLNLTHRNGHEHPEPLPTGRDADVTVVMDECAYEVPKGHRIRLSLSSAYWPMIWPAPRRAVLDIDLAGAELRLPVFRAPPGGAEVSFGPPRHAPPLNLTELEPPDTRCEVSRNAVTGAVSVYKYDNHGVRRFPGHGLETGAVMRCVFFIRPDDPLSARQDTHWTQTLGRGDWGVRTETRTWMTCDAETFYFGASVEAFENGAPVSQRTWEDKAPRRLV